MTYVKYVYLHLVLGNLYAYLNVQSPHDINLHDNNGISIFPIYASLLERHRPV